MQNEDELCGVCPRPSGPPLTFGAGTADTASGLLLDQAGANDPLGDMEYTGPGEVFRHARVDEEELRMFEADLVLYSVRKCALFPPPA